MNNRLTLVQGLVALVKSQDSLTEEQFQKFAGQLQGLHKGVLSLQLAPKAIVKFVTQREKNKKAVGYNLLGDPKRRKNVLKAIKNRRYIIAGPINLIQGGTAIIGRWPIFKIDPTLTSKQETFWGFATILINPAPLLEEAGLFEKKPGNLAFALRGKNGLGAKGAPFWGDKDLFQKDSILTKISLPTGSWQLAAYPKSGWKNDWAGRIWLWIGGLILALLTGWATFTLMNRPAQLRKVIDTTTRALQASEARLHGAVETLQEAFALYDPDDRLVMCNQKYIELHDCTGDLIKPGMRFEDMVRKNVLSGAFIDAIGREEEAIQERLESHRNPHVNYPMAGPTLSIKAAPPMAVAASRIPTSPI